MKSLLVYLKGYKKETVLAPLFKMLEASFELLVPLVVTAIIDVGIAQQDKDYILKMGMLMIALGLIGLVCSITAQFYAAKAAVGFATGLRHALFQHIQSLSFAEMDTAGTSTLITRMTSDVNQVQSGVNLVLRLFLRSPFIVFGAMIMAFTIDVQAALIFVVTIPLLSIVVFGIMLISIPLYKKVQAGLDKVLGITRENLTGMRVIRAFHKEAEETEHFVESNQALTGVQMFVGRISALMNPITYVIVNGATIALLYCGAIRVDSGILTQGNVVALVNYMSQILVELVKLANLIITVTKAMACARRLEKVFDMQSSLKEKKQETKQEENTEGNSETETEDTVVEFKKASLTYQNAGEESLSGISLKVKRGQTIGIIGGTGSGKTSLVHLIPRFYDVTKGEVLVDGRNVMDYPIRELRHKIGMVMQKAVLFQGSIRDNLLWGNEDASEEELAEALHIAQAEEFVAQKPGGMDFVLTQGAKNLSGGQKQRLTIARALVRRPEILILDDSASALDFATDAALRQAIRGMEDGPTVFIVSQRAASIQYADQIIVLDDGKVAGLGRHEELLESCSVYQEIYYSQFPKENGQNTGREAVSHG
ncbi:MAG: ABC transporter ATP-binding protein [Lachnospiraceae bacterium]|nr:ABC transporter ATP-binding protein [Lachnospiraceae bacterium]